VSKGRTAAIDRIKHMIAAANPIAKYAHRGRVTFDTDSTVRDAILYQLVVIGEAAKATIAADESIATEVPAVEWSLWAKMRDRITHQYWATDHEIVWLTATQDVEHLRADLLRALVRL
jgi:uncharacterized protein with HEPN domain